MALGDIEHYCQRFRPELTVSLDTARPMATTVLTSAEAKKNGRFGPPSVTIDHLDQFSFTPDEDFIAHTPDPPAGGLTLDIWRREPKRWLEAVMAGIFPEVSVPHFHLGMGFRTNPDERTEALSKILPPDPRGLIPRALNDVYTFYLGSDTGWSVDRGDVQMIGWFPSDRISVSGNIVGSLQPPFEKTGLWQGNPSHPFRLDTSRRPCLFEFLADGIAVRENLLHCVFGVRSRFPIFAFTKHALLQTMKGRIPTEDDVRPIIDPYVRFIDDIPDLDTRQLT